MTDAIGKLERDIDARMRAALPEAFAAMTRRDGEPPTVEIDGGTARVIVSPAPSDTQIEALLGSLMVESFLAAQKSYQLARNATAPGQLVALRDVYIHQAARLSRACAEVADALARRRGGGQQKIVVEHVTVNRGGQAIVGAVNR